MIAVTPENYGFTLQSSGSAGGPSTWEQVAGAVGAGWGAYNAASAGAGAGGSVTLPSGVVIQAGVGGQNPMAQQRDNSGMYLLLGLGVLAVIVILKMK